MCCVLSVYALSLFYLFTEFLASFSLAPCLNQHDIASSVKSVVGFMVLLAKSADVGRMFARVNKYI